MFWAEHYDYAVAPMRGVVADPAAAHRVVEMDRGQRQTARGCVARRGAALALLA